MKYVTQEEFYLVFNSYASSIIETLRFPMSNWDNREPYGADIELISNFDGLQDSSFDPAPTGVQFIGDVSVHFLEPLFITTSRIKYCSFKACSLDFISAVLLHLRCTQMIEFVNCIAPIDELKESNLTIALNNATCQFKGTWDGSFATVVLYYPLSSTCTSVIGVKTNYIFAYGDKDSNPKPIIEAACAVNSLHELYIYDFKWTIEDLIAVTSFKLNVLTVGGELIAPLYYPEIESNPYHLESLDISEFTPGNPGVIPWVLQRMDSVHKLILPSLTLDDELLGIFEKARVSILNFNEITNIDCTDAKVCKEVLEILVYNLSPKDIDTLTNIFPSAKILNL